MVLDGTSPFQNQGNYLLHRHPCNTGVPLGEQAELLRLLQPEALLLPAAKPVLKHFAAGTESLRSEPGGAAEEMCAFRQIASLSGHQFPEYRAVVRINGLIWLKRSGRSLAFSNP